MSVMLPYERRFPFLFDRFSEVSLFWLFVRLEVCLRWVDDAADYFQTTAPNIRPRQNGMRHRANHDAARHLIQSTAAHPFSIFSKR